MTERTDHYSYCKNATCEGCLPTDEELAERTILGLWGEMLARGIAQTPQTKTKEGALAAIVADGQKYREFVISKRRQMFGNETPS